MMNAGQHARWERETKAIAEKMASRSGRFDLSGTAPGDWFWGCTQCFKRCGPGEGPTPFNREVLSHGCNYQVSGVTGCPNCGASLSVIEVTGEGTGTRVVPGGSDDPFFSNDGAPSVDRAFEEAGL